MIYLKTLNKKKGGNIVSDKKMDVEKEIRDDAVVDETADKTRSRQRADKMTTKSVRNPKYQES